MISFAGSRTVTFFCANFCVKIINYLAGFRKQVDICFVCCTLA